MSPPPETPGPYAEQTAANTRTDWLSGQQPLEADLDGIDGYAADMKTISENLRDLKARLSPLGDLPNSAWDGYVLAEAAYMKSRFTGDFAEFSQYFFNLEQALMNVGMVAQTISDAYRGTDGWSAASLDTVRWAFGDANVPTPAGLPSMMPQTTFFDALQAARENGAGPTTPASPDTWTNQEPVVEDGVTTLRATNQDGDVRTVTEQFVPGTGLVTTVTVTDRDGNVLSETRETSSSYSYPYGHTSTVATEQDGQPAGRTTTSTSSNGAEGGYTETTSRTDGEGEPTGGTATRRVDGDGDQTLTTENADGQTTSELHIGEDTQGAGDLESPANEAIERLTG